MFDILTKLFVHSEDNIFAVLSFKSSNDEMPPSDRLEVIDKCIIDCCAAKRPNNRNGLRCRFLANDCSEPRGDLRDQSDKNWTAFLDDASLRNKACSFGDGFRENPAYDEIVALRCIVLLCPTAEAKYFYT